VCYVYGLIIKKKNINCGDSFIDFFLNILRLSLHFDTLLIYLIVMTNYKSKKTPLLIDSNITAKKNKGKNKTQNFLCTIFVRQASSHAKNQPS